MKHPGLSLFLALIALSVPAYAASDVADAAMKHDKARVRSLIERKAVLRRLTEPRHSIGPSRPTMSRWRIS